MSETPNENPTVVTEDQLPSSVLTLDDLDRAPIMLIVHDGGNVSLWIGDHVPPHVAAEVFRTAAERTVAALPPLEDEQG